MKKLNFNSNEMQILINYYSGSLIGKTIKLSNPYIRYFAGEEVRITNILCTTISEGLFTIGLTMIDLTHSAYMYAIAIPFSTWKEIENKLLIKPPLM